MKRAIILSSTLLALVFGLIGTTGPAYGASFVVDSTTNASDSDTGDNACNDGSGNCSLRAAIMQANALTGPDQITFNIAGCGGPCIITPDTPFPFITDPVVIDATTNPGFDPGDHVPAVILNGALLGGTVDGLRVTAGNTTVRGLTIYRFGTVSGSDGIELSALGGNTIEGNCIGTDALCTDCDDDLPGSADIYGNIGNGILINATSNNTIGGTTDAQSNVLGCNDDSGVRICTGVAGCSSGPATNNLIIGNLIGGDRSGTQDLGNTDEGVFIENAAGNTVGGTNVAERNLIGGNGSDGVEIKGATATGNVVLGNYIGTNLDGTDDLRNSGAGVNINGAANNRVGGPAAGARNLLSGNLQGVQLTGAGATGNIVEGNFVGTNANGDALLDPILGGNLGDGIFITNAASSNLIGGTSAASRNVISGNNSDGIELFGTTTKTNTIQGNFIGTDVTGTIKIGNGSPSLNSGAGVKVNNAPSNTIGGTAPGSANVLSGNEANGVALSGGQGMGNVIQGNLIGTDLTGSLPVPNGADGIAINSAKNTIIGGSATGAQNVISGNGSEFISAGVFIEGANATGNVIQQNLIGTDGTGANDVGNSGQGVFINGSPNNLIGGTSTSSRNVISGNGTEGVLINQQTATNVQVQGNYIGVNAAGTGVVANSGDGLRIASSPGNLIGGTASGARNVISGNGAVGIDVLDPFSTGNLIQGNFIGTDFTGTLDRGNALEGVYINGGTNTTVGGNNASMRNVISGNLHGVGINDAGAQNNLVTGNFIGTNAFGTGPVLNTFAGVRIAGNASNNTIGGGGGSGNVIAYNGGDGVFLDQTAGTGNRVDLNQIFLNGGLGIDIFPDGVNANDAGDPDTGPNNLQNYPVITDADSSGSGTTITASLNSVASTAFTIQFYSDPSCDPQGNGEGQIFIGSIGVNTNGSGNVNFNPSFATVVAGGHFVTAIATDPGGNTSEFSACFQVAGPPAPTLKQGDVDCDGLVNAVDALKTLRYSVALSVVQTEPCPDIGTVLSQVFGDSDCTGFINSVDALKILRFAASLAYTQTEPCTDIGQNLP